MQIVWTISFWVYGLIAGLGQYDLDVAKLGKNRASVFWSIYTQMGDAVDYYVLGERPTSDILFVAGTSHDVYFFSQDGSSEKTRKAILTCCGIEKGAPVRRWRLELKRGTPLRGVAAQGTLTRYLNARRWVPLQIPGEACRRVLNKKEPFAIYNWNPKPAILRRGFIRSDGSMRSDKNGEWPDNFQKTFPITK
jgi:hypothetical protein